MWGGINYLTEEARAACIQTVRLLAKKFEATRMAEHGGDAPHSAESECTISPPIERLRRRGKGQQQGVKVPRLAPIRAHANPVAVVSVAATMRMRA